MFRRLIIAAWMTGLSSGCLPTRPDEPTMVTSPLTTQASVPTSGLMSSQPTTTCTTSTTTISTTTSTTPTTSTTTTSTTTTTTTPEGICPSGWTYQSFNGEGNCYLVLRGPPNTCGLLSGCTDGYFVNGCGQALTACESLGASLVSIHSTAENSYVQGLGAAGGAALCPAGELLLRFCSFDAQTCIGLVMETPFPIGVGQTTNRAYFIWSDGTTVDYTRWGSGWPDNDGRTQAGAPRQLEACAQMITYDTNRVQGTWNDVGCDFVMRNAVCKQPANCPMTGCP